MKLAKLNQSVEKVFQIIEIMASEGEPMRLQDIAQKSGLPAPTALRLINTLVTYGYALQDESTLRYSLSLKFAQIGGLVSSQISVRDIARPYVIELSRTCRESACLAIEQGMEVVYIDVVYGPDDMLKIMQRIGKRAPMHCTGIGKMFLTNYTKKQLFEYASEKGLPPITPNTITDVGELDRELALVRERGYAVDNEECELGARCVSAGITDYSGKVILGISVSGPAARMTPERVEELSSEVIRTGRLVSEKLVGRGI
ncbi:IclR family transcriptional regulator [Oscillospiraceae bacterium OttesenSCG-928-G22]|nr:IclR family transcriptional regulator [Oscillospiraceae bacterium OttesenSCG-928-G22]